MKKYNLTNETRIINGVEVYRIQAAKDFEDVKKGDKGGFVNSEYVLSQDDDCWIYGDSVVIDGRVCNYAVIQDGCMILNSIIENGAEIVASEIKGCRIGKESYIKESTLINDIEVINTNIVYSKLKSWSNLIINDCRIDNTKFDNDNTTDKCIVHDTQISSSKVETLTSISNCWIDNSQISFSSIEKSSFTNCDIFKSTISDSELKNVSVQHFKIDSQNLQYATITDNSINFRPAI